MYISIGGIHVHRCRGDLCTQVCGEFMYSGMGGIHVPRYGGIHVPRHGGGIHVLCTQVWRGFMYPVMEDSCTQVWGDSCFQVWGFRYIGMGVFMYPGLGWFTYPGIVGGGDSTNGRLSFFPLYEMFLNITFEPFKNQITHKAWNIQALLFYNILSFSRLNIYTLSLNMFIVLCRQIVF